MAELKGKKVYLRALEPEDLDYLYNIENNTAVWHLGGTIVPYSKMVLQKYLEQAHRDIYEVRQLRLVISNYEPRAIGLIDLFDFDPVNRRAGVGIIVVDENDRNKGLGTEALGLLCNYAFETLGCHQLYSNILEKNLQSRHMFLNLGFEFIGIKKDWILQNGSFENEMLFQKINRNES